MDFCIILAASQFDLIELCFNMHVENLLSSLFGFKPFHWLPDSDKQQGIVSGYVQA